MSLKKVGHGHMYVMYDRCSVFTRQSKPMLKKPRLTLLLNRCLVGKTGDAFRMVLNLMKIQACFAHPVYMLA